VRGRDASGDTDAVLSVGAVAICVLALGGAIWSLAQEDGFAGAPGGWQRLKSRAILLMVATAVCGVAFFYGDGDDPLLRIYLVAAAAIPGSIVLFGLLVRASRGCPSISELGESASVLLPLYLS
jgi:hypothetical protein